VARFPKLGKIHPEFFEDVIYPKLGAKREEVIHGPKVGLDNGVVQIGADQVLVVTTDPLSYIPELGPRDSAWISVHLIVSDLITSGFAPQYAVLNLNLPPQLSASDFQIYWEALHEEFEKLDTAVIAGHTGRYSGCDFTIIGSGTLMAFGSSGQYLSPELARPGDQLILTKGPLAGTAGLLAKVFPETLETRFDRDFVERAQEHFTSYATIHDAEVALSVGIRDEGVTSMHDVAEGGVYGALYEMALAADCGFSIEQDKIPISCEAQEIATFFGLNPCTTLSEGALLITAIPDKADVVLAALHKADITAARVGELLPKEAGMKMIENSAERPFEAPEEDKYWDVYQQVKSDGWK